MLLTISIRLRRRSHIGNWLFESVGLIASVGAAPDNDGLRIKNTGSTTVYVGGAAVTTASGLPVASTDGVVNIPTTGSEPLSLYGISATTATVSYIFPG